MPPSRPALLGGTQNRKGQPQFMFPSSDMNFEKGRFLSPSNNAPAQSLFQRNDPFAQNVPGVGTGASEAPAGVSSVLDVALAQSGAGVVDPIVAQPVVQAPALSTASDPRDDPTTAAGSFRPTGDQLKLVQPVRALDILENPKGAAAQVLGGVLINNPFISAKGRQALREGRVPQMNDLQPAFFRFTDPTVIAELQQLIAAAQGSGESPSIRSQEFFSNVFTAPSL